MKRQELPNWLRDRHNPKDATALLKDPCRIYWACDMARNPAFHGADARTKGFGGQRVVDAYRAKCTKEWASELERILHLDAESFKRALPPLAVKTINQEGSRVPWGPWGDPTFCEEEAHNLERVGLVGTGKERVVAKPCPVRRMLDNAFEHVLVATADHKLSKAAVAYRPGRRDAVRGVILGVQKAVKNGARFWAKLDVKSFFPTLPWSLIQSSLQDLGYHEEFVQKVMALVQVPLVDDFGKAVQPTAGSQAGVRISGILANIALSGLDKLIEESLDPKTSYWRYSDDLILVGHERHKVENMVKKARTWIKAQAMRLKGVGERYSSECLVHDVAKKRVEVLGAEVNKRAQARPSAERLAAFVARLQHRVDFLAPIGEPIIGISNYTRDVTKKGRYVFDASDVEQQLDQFINFWDPINRGFVKDFLADHGLQGLAPTPQNGGSTWLAVIPTKARPGERAREAIDGPCSFPNSRVSLSVIVPHQESPKADLGALTGIQAHDGDEWVGQGQVRCTEGCSSLPDAVPSAQGNRGQELGHAEGRALNPVPTPSPTPQGEGCTEGCSFDTAVGQGEVRGNGEGRVFDPMLSDLMGEPGVSEQGGMFSPCEVVGDDLGESGVDNHTEMNDVMDEYPHSFTVSHSISCGSPYDDWAEQEPEMSDREGPASLLQVSDDRVVRIRIAARVLPEDQGVVAEVVDNFGRVLRSGPRCGRYPSAVLRLLLLEIDRAALQGAEALVVELDSGWLPKALVQRTRRFHAPALFDIVLRVHTRVEESGVRVELLGPEGVSQVGGQPGYPFGQRGARRVNSVHRQASAMETDRPGGLGSQGPHFPRCEALGG